MQGRVLEGLGRGRRTLTEDRVTSSAQNGAEKWKETEMGTGSLGLKMGHVRTY